MRNSEKNLIGQFRRIIKSLLAELNITKWKFAPIKERMATDPGYDLKVKLDIGRRSSVLLIEVRSSGEPRFIAGFAGLVKASKAKGYPVIAAPFISSRGRQLCKELGIGCIDLAGNAYLRFNGLLIDRRGRTNEKAERRILKRLFTKKCTRILRILFLDLERTWTLAGLAKEAGVSLGQTAKVADRLAREEFLDKTRGKIRLKEPGKLLDAWTGDYRFNDNKAVGFFSDVKNRADQLGRLSDSNSKDYAVTLGAGASFVAPVVRSTDLYIYCKDSGEEMKRLLELEPVEFGGNIYLVEPPDDGVFLDSRAIEGVRVVSNLQLYLDLFNHPMRGREQADAIREKVWGF